MATFVFFKNLKNSVFTEKQTCWHYKVKMHSLVQIYSTVSLVTTDQALGLLDNFTKEKKMLKYFFVHFDILHSAKIVYIFFFEESRICWTSHRLNLTENRLCALTLAFFGRDRHTTRILLTRRTPQGKNFPKFMKLCFFLTLTRWKVSIQTQSLISLKLIFYKVSFFIPNSLCWKSEDQNEKHNSA